MDQRKNPSKTDDTTNNHQPKTPPPSGRGSSFCWDPATQNLCSKSYTDILQGKVSLLFKNLSPADIPSLDFSNLTIPETSPFPCVRALLRKTAAPRNDTANSTMKKNRCHCCNKKIGLLGFACRCGASFCSIHRYPEAHACKFDFKTPARVALAKENPLCKADKMPIRL